MPSRAKCDRRRITAGVRAMTEAVNYPLSTLTACYAAIGGERDDFLARMNQFLSVLEQDSSAVDRLLYAAEMETWMALRPQIPGAVLFGYYFTSTHGEVPNDVSMTDAGAVYLDGLGNQRQPVDVSFLVEGRAGAWDRRPGRIGRSDRTRQPFVDGAGGRRAAAARRVGDREPGGFGLDEVFGIGAGASADFRSSHRRGHSAQEPNLEPPDQCARPAGGRQPAGLRQDRFRAAAAQGYPLPLRRPGGATAVYLSHLAGRHHCL